MILLLLSLLHTVVETACPYGWMQLAIVHQSIFHLDLFSFNPRLAGHFFSLRLADLTWWSRHLFLGGLEYFQSLVLGGIGLSVPLMMSERDLLTTPSVSQSSEKVLVDNCNMDIQPPGTNSYFAGDSSLLPQPINVIHGKVCLQMVLRTLGILIFIMIPSSGNDIIVSTVAVGPYWLIDVWCDECFC